MIINSTDIFLSDGTEVTLRSPKETDAQSLIEHIRITSAQTCFLMRYPDEVDITLEEEKAFIKKALDDTDSFMIVAVYRGEIIGMAGAMKLNNLSKYSHRAHFAISIQQTFQDNGLGTALINKVIEVAKESNFEQLELGVFHSNSRAIHIYEKVGFKQCGVIPRAYKLRDGSYHDEIQMVLAL